MAGADAPISAAAAGVSGWRIEFKPHPSLFATCNDPLRLFRELSAFGELVVHAATEGLPTLADMDPTQCYLHWTLILHAPVARAQVAEVFDWVDANSTILYQPLRSAAPAPVPEPRVESAPPPAPRAETSDSSAMAASSPMPRHSRAAADAGSIRVATEKVDALINLVGELVITQSMLGRFSDDFDPSSVEALRRGLAQLSRNTRELQESVLKIRMLPISFSFNRFPRLVHELSRSARQESRASVCAVRTPKSTRPCWRRSAIRSCIWCATPSIMAWKPRKHGRQPAKATPAFSSSTRSTKGGSVIIEVRDDGAGLNKERILAKAQERGLADPAAAALTDEQIYDLIFLPGFSTAETVSDVSGRGVGMDVVRRNINDLGGHVQISSRAGQGSTVRIRLPLTLAILEGQMLRVGKEIYVISLISIIETVQPRAQAHRTPSPDVPRYSSIATTYLPIVRLHDLFDIEPDASEVDSGLLVVVESDGKRVAILVDELLAQQQVVIKSLDTNFRQIPGLAGATIHGDGTVALILDVPGLIALFMGKYAPQLAA